MIAILALNVFGAACTHISKALQILHLHSSSCTTEIAEPLGVGKRAPPAKEVVLLIELFRLCRPLRLCWRGTPAGIGHACTRDFADCVIMAGDIARI